MKQLMSFLQEILGGDAVRTTTVSLVIHRSQLLWKVSSLDSWVLVKAHDSAAPCRRTDKPWLNIHFCPLNETSLEVTR